MRFRTLFDTRFRVLFSKLNVGIGVPLVLGHNLEFSKIWLTSVNTLGLDPIPEID